MKLTQSVKLGAWILIAANLLMAYGSIWIFLRMSPAIEVIIARNQTSLANCETMLAELAGRDGDGDSKAGKAFQLALKQARGNITEAAETEIIDAIESHYAKAFKGDRQALQRTTENILELGVINRQAMREADARAKQLGYAGAWGVVFMAATTFTVGLIFLRTMRKNLAEPIQEIDAVISAFKSGNPMRRCTMKNPPPGVRQVFNNVNELLDEHCGRWPHNKD